SVLLLLFFFQAEDGIRDFHVTGVQTCALPILVDILGSVLGRLGNQTNQAQNQQNGLGAILGSVLSQFGNNQSATRTSQSSGSSAKSLLIAVLPLVLAWIQKQGGLQGALDKLKGQGLNSQIDDWV